MSGIIGTSHSKSRVIGRSQDTAKAWCNFNGQSTPAIRDSFNCSSITDVNTGRYEVNYIEPMKSQNHVPVASQGGSVVNVMVINEDQNAGVGKCEVGNYRWDTGAYDDTGHIFVAVFGD